MKIVIYRQAKIPSLVITGLLLMMPLLGERFLADDPLLVDPDQLPIQMPVAWEPSQTADFLENTFLLRPSEQIVPAENVNTLGEVPDSSWFENRMGRSELSIEQLERGPDQEEGPDVSQPWKIIKVKKEGVSPGFTIRDARSDVYFIKFDPPSNPQMATSTEVICTKFFHAFGYNVPENYLLHVKREQLEIEPGVTIGSKGTTRELSRSDVDDVLEKVAQDKDGGIQVLASRKLEGESLGPFRYYGTRPDDPNDIFPHQNRRELRGLRVFASWLNHDDTKNGNTLDVFLITDPKEKKGYVRHYLIDFGSALGSSSVEASDPREGNEYYFESNPLLKSALTLGLWDRPWRSFEVPEYPAIGRFDAEHFDPVKWRSSYPNPAFERMRPADAFWAARILSHFSEPAIRAIVRTGRIVDTEAEEYLVKALLIRRDRILRHYFSQLNPLSDFSIRSSGTLEALIFRNLGAEIKLSSSVSYAYQWFRYDNVKDEYVTLAGPQTTGIPAIPLPDGDSAYVMLRISTLSPEQPAWQKPVEVYIRNGGRPSIVGIEREE